MSLMSCSTAQMNQYTEDYIQWKQETGYTSGTIEYHYDNKGNRIGYTIKR
jgi:hypothetical protein